MEQGQCVCPLTYMPYPLCLAAVSDTHLPVSPILLQFRYLSIYFALSSHPNPSYHPANTSLAMSPLWIYYNDPIPLVLFIICLECFPSLLQYLHAAVSFALMNDSLPTYYVCSNTSNGGVWCIYDATENLHQWSLPTSALNIHPF